MPRILSPDALAAFLSQESDEVVLACVRIDHPDLPAPIRIVNNIESVERTDGTYVPADITVELPDDVEEGNGGATLVCSNTNREVLAQIRTLQGKPSCRIEACLASSPNVVEMGPYEFEIVGSRYDRLRVNLTMGQDSMFLDQYFPAGEYTPISHPGLPWHA